MSKADALRPEPFVEALAPDPSRIPEVNVLSGHLGRSPREGHVRLYRNPALTGFIEIPLSDVLHVERFDQAPHRLGSAVLWVRADADIDAVTVRAVGPSQGTGQVRYTRRQGVARRGRR